MDAKDFEIKLNKLCDEFPSVINHSLPVVIGKKAVDFYEEGFHNEGFTDTALVPWQEVKRRQEPVAKGAKGSRPILTGDTKDLGRSIQAEEGTAEVTIHSDLPYASAQNEGTTNAGRSHNVTIPARPFIQESHELDREIQEEIERKLLNLLQ